MTLGNLRFEWIMSMKPRLAVLMIAMALISAFPMEGIAQDLSWPGVLQSDYLPVQQFAIVPPTMYAGASNMYPAGQNMYFSPPTVYPYPGGTMPFNMPLDYSGYSLADYQMPMYPDPDGSDTEYYLDPELDFPSTRLWGSLEYLLWYRSRRSLPPLVTTSPPGTARNGGPLPPIAGVLGVGTTTVLFGGNRDADGPKSGGSITLGYWLDDCNEVGIAGRFFALEPEEIRFNVASDGTGTPTLGRPFFNTAIGASGLQDALLVAFSDGGGGDLSIGSINAFTSNEVLNAEIYLRVNWFRGPNASFDIIAGYQHSTIRDLLFIGHTSTVVIPPPGSPIPAGTRFATFDRFDTRNSFHGGGLGFMGHVRRGRFTLAGLGKVSMGNMREMVTIHGSRTITLGGASVTTPGGLLAQPTNMGTFTRDQFTFVPEAKIELGFDVTKNVNVGIGYNFMYWNNAVFAGDQVDLTLNANQFGGLPVPAGEPSRPAFRFNETEFWVQGLNFTINGTY